MLGIFPNCVFSSLFCDSSRIILTSEAACCWCGCTDYW